MIEDTSYTYWSCKECGAIYHVNCWTPIYKVTCECGYVMEAKR